MKYPTLVINPSVALSTLKNAQDQAVLRIMKYTTLMENLLIALSTLKNPPDQAI